jgi:SAM-dependent methyltransferase
MKLKGDAYLNHWRERMAKGPDEVAHDGRDADTQAASFWSALQPYLPIAPRLALEFGCGYGRMLRYVRERYPRTELHGIDLSSDAIASLLREDRPPPIRLWVGYRVPRELLNCFDLAYTCTCLQHITDDTYLRGAAKSLDAAVRPGGTLLLLENVAKPGADHVRDMFPDDYRALFPAITWQAESFVEWKGQRHVVLAGVKT